MDLPEAEKNIQLLAETTITPDFVNNIQIFGIFLVGVGSGMMLDGFGFMDLFMMMMGASFYMIGWYVRKNFEWKL